MMRNQKLKWLIPLAVILITGFVSSCKSPAPPPPEELKKPKIDPNLSYAWLGFPQPCPTPDDAKILIEKWIPKVVKPGKTFDVKVKVKNNAGYDIAYTALVEDLPETFKLLKVTPAADVNKNHIEWKLHDFTSGKTAEFMIKGKIDNVGSVRYTGKSILNFETHEVAGGDSIVNVIAPELSLETEAPTTSVVNKSVPVELIFKNSGTASVANTKLFYTLPKGILTFQGKSEIELNIGDLGPNEIKNQKVELKGIDTGNYDLNFTAVADNNIEASSRVQLLITKPKLNITINAPSKRYVGNVIPYTVAIKNSGSATAEDTVIELNLPDGTTLASIDNNGIKNGDIITWNIGNLHVNESKTVSVKVVANRIMTARASATVEATSADKLEVAKMTDVAGIAALLCTLEDIHDPVPLGEWEEYVLIATNQGSLPSTKIVAKCYLEDNMEYVKSSGATKGKLEGNVLTFEPLPELAPQAEAKWTIKVKAVKPGDVRFKAEVTSEQLTKPVTLVEPTNFYE